MRALSAIRCDRECRRRRGSIGVGRVARAAPDGYTFDIGIWDTMCSIIYKLDYDLEGISSPIALVSNNPQLMVPERPSANTFGELVTWMKENPGKITSPTRNAAATSPVYWFENLTKQKVQFIPYRGARSCDDDLISGTVDFAGGAGRRWRCRKSRGKIKALANLSAMRSASMPDIPTADETGIPGLICPAGSASGRRGNAKGYHRQTQCRDNRGAGRSSHPEALHGVGARRRPRAQQTPEGLAAFQKAEIEKWWPIIKAAASARRRNERATISLFRRGARRTLITFSTSFLRAGLPRSSPGRRTVFAPSSLIAGSRATSHLRSSGRSTRSLP